MTQKTTITRLTVHDDSDSPVFGDTAVNIEVGDDAGGPFLVLHTCNGFDAEPGKISIDFAQWHLVDAAARRLMVQFDGEEL